MSISLIQNTKDLSYKFMEKPCFVTINENRAKEIAQIIKANPPNQHVWTQPDIFWMKDEHERKIQIVLRELVANSLNYKYWYGKPGIRPNGANANRMYELLDESFKDKGITFFDTVSPDYVASIIRGFIDRLTLERFPMLSQRINHLNELNIYSHQLNSCCTGYDFCRELVKNMDGKESVEDWMERLILFFPGYAHDMFLKRASLFFMQLHRINPSWFANDINKLHIPADYQIPKILRFLGCLKYCTQLSNDILEYKLIPEDSLAECEIRAATIVVTEMMAKEANITTLQIDDYLWLNRKMCQDSFHLTITTNY